MNQDFFWGGMKMFGEVIQNFKHFDQLIQVRAYPKNRAF